MRHTVTSTSGIVAASSKLKIRWLGQGVDRRHLAILVRERHRRGPVWKPQILKSVQKYSSPRVQ